MENIMLALYPGSFIVKLHQIKAQVSLQLIATFGTIKILKTIKVMLWLVYHRNLITCPSMPLEIKRNLLIRISYAGDIFSVVVFKSFSKISGRGHFLIEVRSRLLLWQVVLFNRSIHRKTNISYKKKWLFLHLTT